MWLTPPPYLGLLLSSGFRDKKQELSGSMNCCVKIVPDYFCKVLLPIFTSSLPSPLFSYAFIKKKPFLLVTDPGKASPSVQRVLFRAPCCWFCFPVGSGVVASAAVFSFRL